MAFQTFGAYGASLRSPHAAALFARTRLNGEHLQPSCAQRGVYFAFLLLFRRFRSLAITPAAIFVRVA